MSTETPYVTDYTVAEALEILARTTMRFFDKNDWLGYSGCESPKPLIGEFVSEAAGKTVVIVDGSCLTLIDEADEYGGQSFNLTEG